MHLPRTFASLGIILISAAASAHEIQVGSDPKAPAAFDITRARATTDGRLTTFMMEVSGQAGSQKPQAGGKLPGAMVDAYVWPTRLKPQAVGFGRMSGIVALAVTAHPDFDDTPLFDENGDGDPTNDGASWHAHWVVLGPDKACAGGLKVLDITPGKAVLPPTAPGLPIALDSPGMSPLLKGTTVTVTMPLKNAKDVRFDAVAAKLQVHGEGKTPLLCVTGTYKTGSPDLSMPGVITLKK